MNENNSVPKNSDPSEAEATASIESFREAVLATSAEQYNKLVTISSTPDLIIGGYTALVATAYRINPEGIADAVAALVPTAEVIEALHLDENELTAITDTRESLVENLRASGQLPTVGEIREAAETQMMEMLMQAQRNGIENVTDSQREQLHLEILVEKLQAVTVLVMLAEDQTEESS